MGVRRQKEDAEEQEEERARQHLEQDESVRSEPTAARESETVEESGELEKLEEPALQESDDQSHCESQSDLNPVEAPPPVIVDELERTVVVDERSRRIFRIAELFGMDGAEILVFAGFVSSLGFESIGDFVKTRVEPLMRWVLKMEVRLKQEVTPELLDRLWLDGAQAAWIMNKIQKNKKLWAYVQDYLN